MPGFEFFGAEERKEVNDVLETGILMRYGFDGPRKGIWKAKELEEAICETFGCKHAPIGKQWHCRFNSCNERFGYWLW